jgi:hypothetical protein
MVRPLGIEQSDELLWSVTPACIDSEEAAIFAADVAGGSLQPPFIIVPDGAVATQKLSDVGGEWYHTVRIEVISAERLG